MLLIILMIIVISACTRNGSSEYCAITKPIYFQKDDKLTEKTGKAIIAHNETWKKLCK